MQELYKTGLSFLLGQIKLKNTPRKVWIEVTNACNLQCPECPNHLLEKSQNTFLSKENFLKILDKIPSRVKEINLFHRGEPLLHKEICSFILLAKKKNKFVRIYTNGSLLDKDEEISSLLDTGLDFLAFSVPHPFSEEKSSKSVLEKSMKNLEKVLDLKKEKKLKKPYIKLEILSLGKSLNKKAKTYLQKTYHIANLQKTAFRLPHNWAGNICSNPISHTRKPGQCTFPWYSLVIFVDGTITPCPQDFLGKIRLGNIFKKSMEDIWNGDHMMKLREKHAKGKLTDKDICTQCDRIYRKTFSKSLWNTPGFSGKSEFLQ